MKEYQEQVFNILINLMVNYRHVLSSLNKLSEESETVSIDIYNKYQNNEEQNLEDFHRNWLIGMRMELFNFDKFLIGTRIKMLYELMVLWKVEMDFNQDDKDLLNAIMSEPQLNVQNVYDPIERRMVDIYPDRGNILMKRAERLITKENLPEFIKLVVDNVEATRKFEEEKKAAEEQSNSDE